MFELVLLSSQLLVGLVTGLILVLLAVGLSIIFGMLRVVNFAHGAMYMVGAYLAYTIIQQLPGGFWFALAAVPLVMMALGFLVERFVISPLYSRPPEDPILISFGLALVLIEMFRMIYGKVGLPVNIPTALSGVLEVGLFFFPWYMVFVVVSVGLILLFLWLMLEKTSIGLIVRAGTRDPEIVQALGLDLNRVRIFVFAMGVALAGLAGVVSAPIRGVIPEMGQAILPQSFVVVVTGGLGSFWGTVVSGLLVGTIVSLTSLYFPRWADVVMFMLMGIVLLVRPHGLFGQGQS